MLGESSEIRCVQRRFIGGVGVKGGGGRGGSTRPSV